MRFVVPVPAAFARPNRKFFGSKRGMTWLNAVNDRGTGRGAKIGKIHLTGVKGGAGRFVALQGAVTDVFALHPCAAPAGSPCRTGRRRVAGARPAQRRDRDAERLRQLRHEPEPGGVVLHGYARASTVRQSLDTQGDSLRAAGVTRIFAEKISTRAVIRPELDKAVALASEMRASGVAVTIVVHGEHHAGRVVRALQLAGQELQPDTGGAQLLGQRRQLDAAAEPLVLGSASGGRAVSHALTYKTAGCEPVPGTGLMYPRFAGSRGFAPCVGSPPRFQPAAEARSRSLAPAGAAET
jgi:hypothetical protein